MTMDLLEVLKQIGCSSPQQCKFYSSCDFDETGIRAKSIDAHTESILFPEEWNVIKTFEKDIKLDLPCSVNDFARWVDRNGYIGVKSINRVQASNTGSKPWLTEDPRDPLPEQPWYTAARYFARNLVIKDPSLLGKRDILVDKVTKSLDTVGIKKRGDQKSFNPDTVKKALVKVKLY